MTIHLRVYGRTWAGYRSCYQYTVEKPPTNEREAAQMAGDFQSLDDWHVCQESNEYEKVSSGLCRRIDTFKTLRGWRNGFSNRLYDRIVNGH